MTLTLFLSGALTFCNIQSTGDYDKNLVKGRCADFMINCTVAKSPGLDPADPDTKIKIELIQACQKTWLEQKTSIIKSYE